MHPEQHMLHSLHHHTVSNRQWWVNTCNRQFSTSYNTRCVRAFNGHPSSSHNTCTPCVCGPHYITICFNWRYFYPSNKRNLTFCSFFSNLILYNHQSHSSCARKLECWSSSFHLGNCCRGNCSGCGHNTCCGRSYHRSMLLHEEIQVRTLSIQDTFYRCTFS